MRAVVDTNVVAHYLLGTEPFADEARRFWRRLEGAIAPSLWEAELTNVVWMAVRMNLLTLEEGQTRLGFAARLGIQSISNRKLWRGALAYAVDSGVAAYDTLFIELAVKEKLFMATFDKKVLEAFPAIAKRPGAFLDDGIPLVT